MSKNVEGVPSTYTSKQGQMPTAQLSLIGVTRTPIGVSVTNIIKYKL